MGYTAGSGVTVDMALDAVSNPGVSLSRGSGDTPTFTLSFNDGDPAGDNESITGRAVVNITATGSAGSTVYKLDINYTTLAEVEIETAG